MTERVNNLIFSNSSICNDKKNVAVSGIHRHILELWGTDCGNGVMNLKV